jgi:hypothetical protein
MTSETIDPNLQDATFVTSNLDWILAEFVRHNVPAAEAQRIVDGLVTRSVPAIQDFGGFLKVQAGTNLPRAPYNEWERKAQIDNAAKVLSATQMEELEREGYVLNKTR